MANLKSTTVSDTGFLQLPKGTTAERPASPTAGEIRFNTDTKVTEWYDDQLAAWFPTGTVPPVATGGDTVEDVDIDGVTYRIHSFTSVGESTFTVTRGGSVDYLIVAGGGGGGDSTAVTLGGGGAGGFLTSKTNVSTGPYSVTVGNGGPPNQPGQNSSAFEVTAFGGGNGGAGLTGGTPTVEPKGGGSGGGGGNGSGIGTFGAAGTPGQGNKGGDSVGPERGGGGGGAGAPGRDSISGNNGGDGGSGISFKITGSLKFFAGGGGGGSGSSSGNIGGAGGIGGGGKGESANSGDAENGQPNTGGGGGGCFENGAGAGGSGIVIIRYRIS